MSDRTTTSVQDYLLQVVDGAPGVVPTLVRGGLRALSWLYGAGLSLDCACYRLGLARVTRLPAEVVGVGNLSMGGTGKTLATIQLAREFTAAGRRVAILSRGYGRTSHDAVLVVSTPDGVVATAAEAGDEPYLLATRLPGIPVLVGKNRRHTGRYAIDTFGADLLLLDDSFQYWRLHKDHEIVLLDALQPAGRDHLLPRGLLREPWRHLQRAHEVWITHAHLAPAERVQALGKRIARYAPGRAVRYTEHRPLHLCTPHGQLAPLQSLRGRPVLALSGLGNPHQFEAMLTELGAMVTPCRFPDHHRYTAEDIAAIHARVDHRTLVVTTAKDAMRLPAHLPFPLWLIEVELQDVAAPSVPNAV